MDIMYIWFICGVLFIYVIVKFLFYNTYYTYELFTNNTTANENTNKIYVLLGDSILKNDAYVSDGKSVENILSERITKLYCFAEDNSKIVDIYSQIDKMLLELNTPNTLVFLSVGGNDILSNYVDQQQSVVNIKAMFVTYKNIIQTIHSRLPEAKLYLLDIYYPDNLKYKQFHSIIQEWNNMLYDYTNKNTTAVHGVIRISNYVTQKDDYSFGIEPSVSGGKKIADLIINT
jgi:hypothetical protein